ncbi:hypothetical protein EJ08DRAFT_499406 [Tothia fuscella]|uniref:Uncharacterized protein n=1 Tax=Tothia fuscella TaxID=1048955 RepID=A0A9P4NZ49_9PEZI|nr:hypothetical protein EJ08DRAFT_499406 [Tothia fuscella]
MKTILQILIASLLPILSLVTALPLNTTVEHDAPTKRLKLANLPFKIALCQNQKNTPIEFCATISGESGHCIHLDLDKWGKPDAQGNKNVHGVSTIWLNDLVMQCTLYPNPTCGHGGGPENFEAGRPFYIMDENQLDLKQAHVKLLNQDPVTVNINDQVQSLLCTRSK